MPMMITRADIERIVTLLHLVEMNAEHLLDVADASRLQRLLLTQLPPKEGEPAIVIP